MMSFLKKDLPRHLRYWFWQRQWFMPQSPDEARALVLSLSRNQHLDDSLCSVLENAFNISRMRVSDIMIPRPDMIVIETDASRKSVIEKVAKHGHSRYPVIDGDRSSVVGVLLAKDVLMRHQETGAREEFSVKDLMLPPQTFPGSKRLSDLLKDFRTTRSHMGIVVNEYNEAAGLVTIEDVLEEIVGEIEDEHDREAEIKKIRLLGDGRYQIEPTVPLEDFNEHFNVTLQAGRRATIGELVLQRLGHFPTFEEQVEIDTFKFTVTRLSGRRIRLEVSRNSQAHLPL